MNRSSNKKAKPAVSSTFDALWAKEAEDRIRAYEAGKMKSFDGRAVFRGLIKRKDGAKYLSCKPSHK